MNNYRKHLKAALITALGYGLGFVVSVIVVSLIFDSGLLESIGDLMENQHLVIGIILLFIVVMFGGALTGLLGGLSLWVALSLDDWKRPASRSALGFGFGFGIVLMPLVILLAARSLYAAGDSSPVGFVISVGVIGLLFGFVSGTMSATLPQRGNYWRITAVLTLAFGIAGLAFGFGLWNYFYTLYQTGVGTAQLLFAFFVFGGMGGLVLGWILSRDLERTALVGEEEDIPHANIFYRFGEWFRSTRFYQKRGFWGTLIFVVLIFLLTRLVALSPLNFTEASLAETLPLDSIGIHWSEIINLPQVGVDPGRPSVAVSGTQTAVAWTQEDGVYYVASYQMDSNLPIWEAPVKISEIVGSNPDIALDSTGRIHIVWEEPLPNQADSAQIRYRSCAGGLCDEPVVLSDPEAATCGGDQNHSPVIAIDDDGSIMVVWADRAGLLASLRWEAAGGPSGSQSCAVSELQGMPSNPRLAAQPAGGFVLVFDNHNEISIALSTAGESFELEHQENGNMPDVFVDGSGLVHVAWCGNDGNIRFRQGDVETQTVMGLGCTNRPLLSQDAEGILHLLWYATQVQQPSGNVMENNLIYESRLVSGAWTQPAIVDLSAPRSQPDLAAGVNGMLHLVWEDLETNHAQISYSNYRTYECDEANLNTQGQLALEVARSGKYRPPEDLVPYCQNRFDDLLTLPKANPAYSDNQPTLNGAFDDVSELVKSARYEVLLSTMWYETDDTGTSPGAVLGQGVKELYDRVKANPERYPRGMTVRILLDNPPEFTLSRLISQVWNVFSHMRDAGLPTMSDPEIGWRFEVGNFDGSWPHGHTKMVVIDGKTAVAAGFNYQHKHQSKDHPSGKGKDDYDLGLQMTGPVAQTTRIAFDDLWSGSNNIVCPDLGSDSPLWWISCRRDEARADHVPEVMKLYLASEDFNAFALHRTDKFQESDVTVPKTIAAAQETLDVLQVNFTLEMICDLNFLFEVCDFRDAPAYLQSIMQAVETNNVKTRVLIKPGPIEAVESNIAVDAFRDALAARGLSHLVEFRYFQDSVHAKSVLIDDQFLLVGSQNFHYSAYGDGALTEFNIGTDDPDAIAAFKRFFDYHWKRAQPIPIQE